MKKYEIWDISNVVGYVPNGAQSIVPGITEVSFEMAVDYAKKHMKFTDRLSKKKVGMASIEAYTFLLGLIDGLPKEPWRFKFK